MSIDPKTQTELEAAAFRRLTEHLRSRTDVQNIDLMNLAGFCRNCLSNWLKDAADARGVPLSKEDSRTACLRHVLRGVEGEAPERGECRATGLVREEQGALDQDAFAPSATRMTVINSHRPRCFVCPRS